MSPLHIGLTGGIASGKSTVAKHFRNQGALVIDMDRVAHEVVEPDGPAYRPVLDTFGDSILDPDGKIDRKKLGPIVFADPDKLEQLNQIVHPEVHRETERRIAAHDPADVPLVFIDAALLVETGSFKTLDRLVVVRCSPEVQRARVIARDGISSEEADRRIAAQYPLEHKLAVADYVIDSEQPLEAMLEQAEEVFQALLQEARHAADAVAESELEFQQGCETGVEAYDPD